MLPKTRAVLDTIDEALSIGDQAARELWHVLSALRGPDSGDAEVKSSSTVLIRIAAFPKTAKIHRHNTRLAQFATDVDFRVPREEQEHFRWHVQWAAEVLGLDGYDG